MRNQTRNLGCAALALAALLAWDAAVMTAGSLPGSEAVRLSAQETDRPRNKQDEERMFMEARRALNREEFDRAAELFQALRDRYPVSPSRDYGRFVPDSYYWEAFGRYRQGNFDEALMLLDLVRVYDEAQATFLDGGRVREGRIHDDVRNLRTRIQRQLAELGDPDAAEAVIREAEGVLSRDTVAIREMRLQYDARIREAQAELAAQHERMETAVQEAIAEYRAQMDSTDLREVLGQSDRATLQRNQAEQYRAQLEVLRVLQLRQDTQAHTGASFVNPLDGSLVYWPSGSGVSIWDPYAHDPVLAGIDIHPECEDALTRQEALTSLLRLEVNVMPTVRDVLRREDDCSEHLRYLSVQWLGGEGTDEARDLLADVAREHPDARTRQWAVSRLASFESPEVSEVLVDFLRESDDRAVQDAAIYGLYRQESDEATAALIEFASDGSKSALPRQRAAVLVAERLAPGALSQVFNGLDSDVVKRAYLGVVGARAESGEQITSWLLPVVIDPEHSETVRAAALQAWSRQPSLDLEQVQRTYRMLNPDMRDQFLYGLYQKAQSDDGNADAVIDKMIELAREETDPEVRKRAVYWLGLTGSERAASFLMEILREGSGRPPGPVN